MNPQVKQIQEHSFQQNLFDSILKDSLLQIQLTGHEAFQNYSHIQYSKSKQCIKNDQKRQYQMQNQDIFLTEKQITQEIFLQKKKENAKDEKNQKDKIQKKYTKDKKDKGDNEYHPKNYKITRKGKNKRLKKQVNQKQQKIKKEKNFYQLAWSVVRNFIECQFKQRNKKPDFLKTNPSILKKTHGTRTDLITFFQKQQYEQSLEDIFKKKILYQRLMISKALPQTRKLYFNKILNLKFIFQKIKGLSSNKLINPTKMGSDNINSMEKECSSSII